MILMRYLLHVADNIHVCINSTSCCQQGHTGSKTLLQQNLPVPNGGGKMVANRLSYIMAIH